MLWCPNIRSVSISSGAVAQSCPTLCDPMDCNTPGHPVHHQLPEFTQTHVHWVGDAIQSSHLLLAPSPPTFNLSQHQGLCKWVSFSHQVAKVLEFQLQHQSFQWILRTDFLYFLFFLFFFFWMLCFFFKFLFLLYFTLQYCIGFAIHWHESTMGIHEFPNMTPPPTSHPISSLWIIPVHQAQASCILHWT